MKTFLASVQWMAFIVASSIIAPIAVAAVFGLSGEDTASFVQRTFFVLGTAGLLQVVFGHKLPINEGPAGIWWGVFALYAGLSTTLFATSEDTLKALQGALIASGVLFILLSAAGVLEKISKLFTPAVTGIYLLLLVLQLSKSFLNGMLGVGYNGNTVNLRIAGLSLLTVVLTYYLTLHRKNFIRQYGILLAIAAGWLLFAVCGAARPLQGYSSEIVSLPKLFVFGYPSFDIGMVTTGLFVTFLLLTNMIASMRIVENVLNVRNPDSAKADLRAGGLIAGFNQILAGAFGAIGSVPISGSAGFISVTGITKKLPFLLGSLFVIISSFFPAVMSFFAAIPAPAGYAVTFTIFASMISMAFLQLQKETAPRIATVIGVSLLSGVGVMFVAPAAFAGQSPVIASFFSNGLVFGTFIAIVMDQSTKYFSEKKATDVSS